MLTEYDKAIAGFLTSTLMLLLAFKVPVSFITPEVIVSITPFLTMIVTWLVPNKPPVPR